MPDRKRKNVFLRCFIRAKAGSDLKRATFEKLTKSEKIMTTETLKFNSSITTRTMSWKSRTLWIKAGPVSDIFLTHSSYVTLKSKC